MAAGRKRPDPATQSTAQDTTTKSTGVAVAQTNQPVQTPVQAADSKIRTQAYTGAAPVDSYVPNHANYEVVTMFGKIYSSNLNQSNVD